MTAFLELIKAQVEHAESSDRSWHIQGTFAD